jgi:hypothetical protein
MRATNSVANAAAVEDGGGFMVLILFAMFSPDYGGNIF